MQNDEEYYETYELMIDGAYVISLEEMDDIDSVYALCREVA